MRFQLKVAGQHCRIINPILIGFACCTFPVAASATETFCGVIERTRDGFVSIRKGPGVGYPVSGKALPSDFLFIGTEKCRDDFGPLLCSSTGDWVFVEEVAGSNLKGWVRSSLVRTVTCPGQ
jgi:hypothetical protein